MRRPSRRRSPPPTGLFRDRDAWLPPAARVDDPAPDRPADGASRPRIWRVEAAREGGKPLVDSRVEVARAIDGVLQLRRAPALGGRACRADGPQRRLAGRIAFTQREPIGVVVAVSAFNHPLNLIVHQVAPAIAAGCPVIVKPARRHAAVLPALRRHPARGRPAGAWCQALVIDEHGTLSRAARHRPARRLLQLHRQRRGRLEPALAPGARHALRARARRCRTRHRRRRRRPGARGAGARQGRLLPCRPGLRVGAARLRPPLDRGRARASAGRARRAPTRRRSAVAGDGSRAR